MTVRVIKATPSVTTQSIPVRVCPAVHVCRLGCAIQRDPGDPGDPVRSSAISRDPLNILAKP
eukprot:4228104-Prymnesium_polylepis.1